MIKISKEEYDKIQSAMNATFERFFSIDSIIEEIERERQLTEDEKNMIRKIAE